MSHRQSYRHNSSMNSSKHAAQVPAKRQYSNHHRDQRHDHDEVRGSQSYESRHGHGAEDLATPMTSNDEKKMRDLTCWRRFTKLALIILVCLQLFLGASVTPQGFPESTPKALLQHTYDNSAWCPSTHLSSSTQNINSVNTTSICQSEDDNDEKDRVGGGCQPCRRRFLVIVATG